MGSLRARMWLGGLLALIGLGQVGLAMLGGSSSFFVVGPVLIVCGALQAVLIRRQMRDIAIAGHTAGPVRAADRRAGSDRPADPV